MRIKILASFVLTLFLVMLTCGVTWAAPGDEYSPGQIQNLWYRLMNAVVFFGVLFILLRKPLPKFFRDRREGIARNLEYLEDQARALEETKDLMNKQIADIASERDAILAQYENMGKKEADRIITEAKVAAESIVQKTQTAMAQEQKTARQALMVEIVNLATQAATELVTTNINAKDQKRLTAEFMAQVENLKLAN